VGGWHLGLSKVDEAPGDLVLCAQPSIAASTFWIIVGDYNEGASEIRMGKACGTAYREKAFVMTKIDGRSKKEATKQLDESLERLQVDCIDLVQHHEILRFERSSSNLS